MSNDEERVIGPGAERLGTRPVSPDGSVDARASAEQTDTQAWFDELGWRLVPYEQIRQRWAADTSCFDQMVGEDFFVDCYPWLTHVPVHTGSVRSPGDLYLYSGMDTDLYVIDGDLTVDGVLRIFDHTEYCGFVVTGDLTVRHLMVEFHTRLLVLGALRVDGVAYFDGSDAAEIEVFGPVSARACVVNNGSVVFHQSDSPTHDTSVLIDQDCDLLYAAMRAGQPLA